MPKSIYTPFTYLIRLGSSKHLVLSELDMQEIAIQMIYGQSILPHRVMLKSSEKNMENPM